MFPRRAFRLPLIVSQRRLNSTLVLVEHKDGKVVSSTLNTISAASKLGFPVSALVAGAKSDVTDAVAKAVASTAGISKVIVAKDDKFDRGLPETHAPLIVAATKAGNFSHVLASHSAYGKNVLPRAAALLDVAQVSDIIAIESPDTFQRPIYAGEKMNRHLSRFPHYLHASLQEMPLLNINPPMLLNSLQFAQRLSHLLLLAQAPQHQSRLPTFPPNKRLNGSLKSSPSPIVPN
jgi:hypothetical protein